MSILDFIRSNQEYFEDFITRSTYHSNRIEGSTLSFAATYAILFNDNSFQISAQPREIYEAINHKYALSFVMDHCNEPISQDLIKKICIQINKNINEISGYRTVPVMIRGAEHIPPTPGLLPSLMMQFVYNYEHTVFSSPYERAAQAHIQFEQIHPFPDGNGRTGRLLINYEMLRNNLPPIVIPMDQRTAYFQLIADANTNGLTEFLKSLSRQELSRLETMGFSEKTPEQLRMTDRLKEAQKNAHQSRTNTAAPERAEER